MVVLLFRPVYEERKNHQTLCDRSSSKSQVFCLGDLDGFKITDSVNAPRTSESSLLLPAKYRELRPGAVTHNDPKMKSHP